MSNSTLSRKIVWASLYIVIAPTLLRASSYEERLFPVAMKGARGRLKREYKEFIWANNEVKCSPRWIGHAQKISHFLKVFKVTPLHIYAAFGDFQKVLQESKDSKALSARDYYGNIPLDYVSKSDTILLKHLLDPTTINDATSILIKNIIICMTSGDYRQLASILRDSSNSSHLSTLNEEVNRALIEQAMLYQEIPAKQAVLSPSTDGDRVDWKLNPLVREKANIVHDQKARITQLLLNVGIGGDNVKDDKNYVHLARYLVDKHEKCYNVLAKICNFPTVLCALVLSYAPRTNQDPCGEKFSAMVAAEMVDYSALSEQGQERTVIVWHQHPAERFAMCIKNTTSLDDFKKKILIKLLCEVNVVHPHGITVTEKCEDDAITPERFTQLLSSGGGLQTHTLFSRPY